MCREVCTSIVSHQRRRKMVRTTHNPIEIDRHDLLVDGSTTEEGVETTLLSLRTVTQIKKTTETMGVEFMGHGFLVLNKAHTVGTFGWNGMTTTILLIGNVHMVQFFIQMSDLLIAT